MKTSRTWTARPILVTALAASVLGVSVAAYSASDVDEEVARLIERVVAPDTQVQALKDLEALGCKAVPSIIRRMDDRRPLPIHGISLENRSPDAFEGLRHYGPEQVVDALAAILNQVTGQSFGFIYNGGSDDKRASTVKGWKEYLDRVGPKGVCSHGT